MPDCLVRAEVSCNVEELVTNESYSGQEFADKFIQAEKIAEVETFQNVFLPDLKNHIEDLELKGTWSSKFKNNNPIILVNTHCGCTFWEFFVKASLVKFSNRLPIKFVTFIEERKPKSITNTTKNLSILCPRYNRSRAHNGG